MSRVFSVLAILIFTIAVGMNFIFSNTGPGEGNGSGAADVSKDKPNNPAGEDFISPEDIEVPDQPGGGVPVGEVDVRVKEGRTNGQREFAREFVRAVYGPGPREEHSDAISEYMQRDSYELSAGWSEVEDRMDGSDDAAVMIEFEIEQGPALGTTVPVSAVERFTEPGVLASEDLEAASLVEMGYAVGESYDESVEGGPEDHADASVLLTGSVRYYSQTLVLAPLVTPDGESERWTVLAGSEPRAIDNPNADAPDPDAPKVADPGGGHGGEHGG